MSNNDSNLFELITQISSQMQGIKNDLVDLKIDMQDIKSDIKNLKTLQKNDNLVLANDLKPKIQSLYDSYKESNEKLKKIQNEVSKHEEVILRRVQ